MAHLLVNDQKLSTIINIAVAAGLTSYAYCKYFSRPRSGRSISKHILPGSDVYETDKLISEYLVFHYGKPEQLIPYPFGPKEDLDFPKRCAELCLKHYQPQETIPNRALDIGCAVGRSTFELTRGVQEVIGIDYSLSFINAANKLKKEGKLQYNLVQEGDIVTETVAEVPADIDRSRVTFEQGDACNLPSSLGHFGLVLAANLICRLNNSKVFLARLLTLMPQPGSILVITAPYTWLPEFADKSKWLGGYKSATGEDVYGFQTLQSELGQHFDLIEDLNMPFFIRETARKNQWTVSHATVWRRK
uniref:Methyltransferase type 11 domain-containing protein n=1 Tax=Biomphalaria glabrata TaxID=6526 RepID=A0A2C9K1Q9_BIOGL